jgi:hydroxyethylthiazole kinase-like uncharacterized protein yjeF
MKVVLASQMAQAEKKAILSGADGDLFMQQAGQGISQAMDQYVHEHQLNKQITLLAGKGNNAGDGYLALCHLKEQGYLVQAYHVEPLSKSSELCQKYAKEFKARGGLIKEAKFYYPQPQEVVLDGLFGTGFQGQVPKAYQELIQKANLSSSIIAIDIPSGVDGDTGEVLDVAIEASCTLTLGLIKTGLLLNQGVDHVGEIRVIPFGMEQKYLDEIDEDFEAISFAYAKQCLPLIKRSRHKYQAGSVVGISGSQEMLGASILSALAAFKSGAGMVQLFHPGFQPVSDSYPEVIHHKFDLEKGISIEKANAVFVGPGLGRSAQVQAFLRRFFKECAVPMVIDADALMALKDTSPPKGAILTPHQGEFLNLIDRTSLAESELIKIAQDYSDHHQITLVLKGAFTKIFHPHFVPLINLISDPGMATAGSGDVLTGIITALLAQGLEPLKASLLGVYLHGLSGVYAAEALSSYSVMARDLIDHIPKSYQMLLS